MLNAELGKCHTCSCAISMLFNSMTKLNLHAAPYFYTTNGRLLSSTSSICLGTSNCSTICRRWRLDACLSSQSPIGLNTFSLVETLLQSSAKSSNFCICAASPGATEPHNITAAKRNANLISQTRATMFLRKPPLPEWRWLVDRRVETVQRRAAFVPNVVFVPVLPFDLKSNISIACKSHTYTCIICTYA